MGTRTAAVGGHSGPGTRADSAVILGLPTASELFGVSLDLLTIRRIIPFAVVIPRPHRDP